MPTSLIGSRTAGSSVRNDAAAAPVVHWGGRTRTSNFLINSQAVCQLTYTPSIPTS
jgi:hypothetical protein